MKHLKNNSKLNELRDILTDIGDQKPELRKGISALLGGANTPPKERLTRKQWVERCKRELTRLAIKEKMKSS